MGIPDVPGGAGDSPDRPLGPAAHPTGGAEGIPCAEPGGIVPDAAIVAAGWEARFVADQMRRAEAEALYRELGFEVRAEAIGPGVFGDLCADCALTCPAFVLLYTRRPQGKGGSA